MRRSAAPGKKRRAARLQRSVQAFSLASFLALLFLTVAPLPQSLVPVDLFLRLDPSVAVLIPVAAREWIPALWPGLAVLLVAVIAGRLFCGYICPMGTTLDLFQSMGGGFRLNKRLARPDSGGGFSPAESAPVNGSSQRSDRDASGMPVALRQLKYLLLALLAGAALFGLNYTFWLSPIPLVTRLYALLLHPLVTLAGSETLHLAQPVIASADIASLGYLQILVRRFDSMYFLLVFFGALFVLELVRPRFWCRYLCPAGALLALAARSPLWRRRTGDCVDCGRCARTCPMSAIAERCGNSEHAECITCRACTDRCAAGRTVFAFSDAAVQSGIKKPDRSAAREGADAVQPHSAPNDPLRKTFVLGLPAAPRQGACLPVHLPSRRQFLVAAGVGAGMAAMGYTSLHTPLRNDQRGLLWSETCIRPPAAVPEPDFLARCLRCGQCMKVCPTNGLQPAWFASGTEGMFSPVLVSRRGACEPDCNACGRVCPTGALTPLPLEEKHWAKIGTAVVMQGYCLAWAENKSCVVCEEVCPYGAIKCERVRPGSVPAPVIRAERCFGCGYCEQHCPVRVPAIVVRPLNALRLHGTEYEKAARTMGLSLVPGSREMPDAYLPEDVSPNGLPPGFTE